jgi:hypothetical protein
MDEVKIVTDFILEIRSQDVAFFQAVFTVLVGVVLAGIFVASIGSRPKSGEELFGGTRILRIVLSFMALLFFLLFIFAVDHRQGVRKDYGIKWIGEHISSTQTQTPKELIRQYTLDYYALKKVDSGFWWKFKFYPSAAAFCLLFELFLRVYKPKTNGS